MAKRRGSGGGSGSVVLVVFLVFFILLSIGLGVTTYMGFSQDDSKDVENKKLKSSFSLMEQERDWYQYQAYLYRSYMGYTQNLDFNKLDSLRERVEKGTLTGPGKDEVRGLVTNDLNKKMEWDPAQKRPKENYEVLLAAERKKTEAAETASKGFQEAVKNDQTKLHDLEEQLKTAKDAHEKEFADFKKRASADLEKLLADNRKLMEQLDDWSKQKATEVTSNDQEKQRIQKLLQEKEKTVVDLRKVLREKESQIAILKQTTGAELVANLKTDWKIVRTDSRGETVYINLGSADNVQPQLTFRVHGIGADGRPQSRDKATLQVLSVLSDHLSQAKVSYETEIRPNESKPRHDPRNNPVLPGDVLANPSWSPNQKKHIAIAGVVDVTGSGRDDTEQFVRELERQNIVVDAYLDMRKDFTIKGPGISVQTDFLILGDLPAEIVGAPGRSKEILDKIRSAMDTMKQQATTNGVRVKNLRAFQDEIGYRVPASAEGKKPIIELKGDAGAMPLPAPQPAPHPMDNQPLPPPMPGK